MSRRGRGGGFRGRGGSSSFGSRGRGGFSSSSRGRFSSYKDSGFDSLNRYSGGSDRYSSRGRGDESDYRRYDRPAGPGNYSARDDPRSPDFQRKRMKFDHTFSQASSARHSHEGSYDYGSRYSYSGEKSYGEDRSRGYRDDRLSMRDRSREEYPRKSEQLSSMPPPRGSYRGRVSRGSRGVAKLLARKRSLVESYTARRRLRGARTSVDTLRRLKIQKLRRLREVAARKEASRKERRGSKTDDLSSGEKENWEEDEDDDDKLDDELEIGEDEGENEDGVEKEEKKRVVKKEKKKVKKLVKVKKETEEGEEGEDKGDEEFEEVEEEEEEEIVEEEEVEEEGEEGKNGEEKKEKSASPKKKKSDIKTVKKDSTEEDKELDLDDDDDVGTRLSLRGRPLIKLVCPHCYTRCITFKEYANHLFNMKHSTAMRRLAIRLKKQLAHLRLTQRMKQRDVEEAEGSHGSLTKYTSFCVICKLNYRTPKVKHQASSSHNAMRKFLLPFCEVCRIRFKSPMLYEHHLCSLDHIKRRAKLDDKISRRDEEKSIRELNMDNFMILDSVGNVDDSGEGTDEEGKPSDKEKEDEKKKKAEISLGVEHIKKVEAYFCDVCRVYLPRLDDLDRILPIHCRSRTHLQRFVRFKEMKERQERRRKEEEKRKEAKKLAEEKEKKKNEGKEGSAEKKPNKDSSASKTEEGSELNDSQIIDGEAAEIGENQDDMDQDEGGMDDKLWADVDKDLGDLLREVEPGNKSSDEDDSRVEGGRYDRFRYSEKGNATLNQSSEGDGADSASKANTQEEDEAMAIDGEDESLKGKQND